MFSFKRIHDLKAGDTVLAHGGEFVVEADARASTSHLPEDGIGPSNFAVAPARCIAGRNGGYFSPGSAWTFQGNRHAGLLQVRERAPRLLAGGRRDLDALVLVRQHLEAGRTVDVEFADGAAPVTFMPHHLHAVVQKLIYSV